ncbi:MAG: helix-turn-helix domain-containing protein [Acidimicrobiia bacterium]
MVLTNRSAEAPAVGLRERKKAETRARLQHEALRLFLDRGYEATTVAEIAEAAGVSTMTFYRYFASKDDVVLTDDYDPMLAELVRSRPRSEPPLARIRYAITAGFATIPDSERAELAERVRLILDTPALRSRMWDQQSLGRDVFAAALVDSGVGELRAQVVATAATAVMVAGVIAWAESGGTEDLARMVSRSLRALGREKG